MLGQRQERANLQSNFYWLKFRKILHWLIAACAIIYLLIAAIVYCILFAPSQHYYGNTTEGKILTMPPAQAGS